MSRLYKLFLAALLLVLSSCHKPFIKEYGLEVDTEQFSTDCAWRQFPLYIYCSSDWEVSTTAEWISFNEGTTKGHGMGLAGVVLAFNSGEARTGEILVTSGSLEKTVKVTQSAFQAAWHFSFDKTEMILPAAGGLFEIKVTTNIAPSVLTACRPVASDSWINSISYYSIISDNGIEGNGRKVEARFTFKVDKNFFDVVRSGEISPGLGDIEITELKNLKITQE